MVMGGWCKMNMKVDPTRRALPANTTRFGLLPAMKMDSKPNTEEHEEGAVYQKDEHLLIALYDHSMSKQENPSSQSSKTINIAATRGVSLSNHSLLRVRPSSTSP